MQTTTTTATALDCSALNAAITKIQGQGAWVEALNPHTLRITADGEAMLATALEMIKTFDGGTPPADGTPPAGAFLAIGDPVTHTTHTDGHAGYVEKVSKNRKQVTVRMASQKLMNGCNSGEPDALICHPGGYAGHVSGHQRWEVKPNPEGYLAKFSLRKRGKVWIWKLAGTATIAPGNILRRGHNPHYDFNF